MRLVGLLLLAGLLEACAGPGFPSMGLGLPLGPPVPQNACVVLGPGTCTTLPTATATPQKTAVRLEAGQPDLVGSVECVPVHGAIRDGKQVLMCH